MFDESPRWGPRLRGGGEELPLRGAATPSPIPNIYKCSL